MTTTYNNLTNQIIAYANKGNSADFITAIPFFIAMGQERIWRDLKTLGFESVEEIKAMEGNKAIIEKPRLWNETLSIIYGDTDSPFNKSKVLFPRSYEFCINYWPNANISNPDNPPLFYADRQLKQEGGEGSPYQGIFISPTPDKDYQYQITYLTRVNPINNKGVETNILTDHYPDLLFYSCVLEALIYLKDDQRMAVYQDLYKGALSSANELTNDRYTDRGVRRDKD